MVIEVKIDDDKRKDKSLFTLDTVLTTLRSFEVPDFQREYVWDKKKVDLFFRDFENLEAGEDNKRFMGVVLYEAENGHKPKLLDGQQRIITSLLAFAAAVHCTSKERRFGLYSSVGNYIKSTADDSTYTFDIEFKNCESHSDEIVDILTNKPADWKENGKVTKNEYQSIKRMKENYLAFVEKYKLYPEEQRDEKICSFIDKVFNNSHFLMIKTDNMEEAFTLFESLNYRGVSLRSFELINNYILHTYSNENARNTHRKTWDVIKNNLQSCGTENIYDKFLEVFWYCYKENKASTESIQRDWYNAYVSMIVDNSIQCSSMVSKMKIVSEIMQSLYYKGYDYSKSKFITKENAKLCKIEQHVHMFRTLDYNAVIVPVYVSALLYEKDYEKINDLFDVIETYCIRNVWICGKKLSKAIKEMEIIARSLSKTGDISKTINALNNKLESDSVFEDNFKSCEPKVGRDDSSDSRKIKLIFSRIFDIEELSSMDSNFSAFSIEHICAVNDRNPFSVVPNHRNRFGNLTVMSKNKNKGTDPYYEKIVKYHTETVLCAKCLENICSRYSSGDKTVLDYGTLTDIKAEDLLKAEPGTYWCEGEKGYINGKSRFSVWEDYLAKQFIRFWPKEKNEGEVSEDGKVKQLKN